MAHLSFVYSFKIRKSLSLFFCNNIYPLKQSSANVIISQWIPKRSKLICITSKATANDGINIEWSYFWWIFRYQVAQFVPQLMIWFSMLGNKVILVDNLSKFDCSFVQSSDRNQIFNVLLCIFRCKLQINKKKKKSVSVWITFKLYKIELWVFTFKYLLKTLTAVSCMSCFFKNEI